ncbi:MAG: helix-turn-helix domain-containing protein [Trichodesmium sp. MAG_R04]|nr:helix-turn-helix domain-containing protein [Trichodesmium sp. MAG_R04]
MMKGRPYIADHLSILELKDRARKSQDTVEARKWQLLYKVSLGWSIKNSAIATSLSYKYAQSILQKYNQKGAEGVVNKKRE